MTSFKSTLGLILLGWSLLHSPATAAKWNLRGLGVNFSTDAPTDSPVPPSEEVTIEVVVPVEEDPVEEEPVEEDPPAEEAPVEEAPVEEDPPAEEDPVEEAPVEEDPPAEEEPVAEEPVEPVEPMEPLPDLATLAASEDGLKVLVDLVVAAELAGTLTLPGPFTIFAPTNGALEEAIDLATLDEIPKDVLFDFLTYHVVGMKIMSSDIEDGSFVKTLQGEDLAFDVEEYGIIVNDAKVIAADIEASNGVVHVIDKALYPQAILNAPPATEPPLGTVEDELKADSDLSVMNMLVVQTDLAVTLDSSEGNYTVFAPTNAAFFSAMNAMGMEASAEVDPAILENLLSYHVVDGAYAASDITDGLTLETLQGGSIVFGVSEEDGVTVNGAHVEVPAVPASNGMIHKIDAALIPGTVIVATP